MVLTDHRPEAIIACLGALKAGKIMVAADPSFPIDRLKFMTDDSRAEAVLTYGDNIKIAAHLVNRNRSMINVDALGSDISIDNLSLKRAPDDPAIIRYTSGSSGRPKGVIRNHRRSLFSYMSLSNRTALCPEDRLIILRRLSFNTGDTFKSLMAGAAIFPYDIKERGVQGLGEFLRAEKITYFLATPSIFRYFAQELGQHETFPHLRLIKLGGEPLFRADVNLYKSHFAPNCILLNQLSASEMGNICQYWISKDTMIDSAIVPVGYPVANKKVLLVDDACNEVDTNCIGEFAVASRYLSTGYWNDSGLTSEKFLRSRDNTDERLYLSGDLGRMIPNGCFLHLGRKDNQVKIRGAKVEFGEVEAVLSEHPQIKQSAVLAFDRPSGDKYLTAYVVLRGDPAPTVTDINAYFRDKACPTI